MVVMLSFKGELLNQGADLDPNVLDSRPCWRGNKK